MKQHIFVNHVQCRATLNHHQSDQSELKTNTKGSFYGPRTPDVLSQQHYDVYISSVQLLLIDTTKKSK